MKKVFFPVKDNAELQQLHKEITDVIGEPGLTDCVLILCQAYLDSRQIFIPHDDTDVHTEHCCAEHGCKYGKDDTCSVMTGNKHQSFPCEVCNFFDLDDEFP